MLMRWDPFRGSEQSSPNLGTPQYGAILMDAYRRSDHVIMHFDLPGVPPETIELTAHKNVLEVRAERVYSLEKGDELLCQERGQGVFRRQVLIGEALDIDKIEAMFDHGVLTVMIPLNKTVTSRRVDITSGSERPQAIVADIED